MNSGLGWTKLHLRILNFISSLNLACFKLFAEYNFPKMDSSSLINYQNLFKITNKHFWHFYYLFFWPLSQVISEAVVFLEVALRVWDLKPL